MGLSYLWLGGKECWVAERFHRSRCLIAPLTCCRGNLSDWLNQYIYLLPQPPEIRGYEHLCMVWKPPVFSSTVNRHVGLLPFSPCQNSGVLVSMKISDDVVYSVPFS